MIDILFTCLIYELHSQAWRDKAASTKAAAEKLEAAAVSVRFNLGVVQSAAGMDHALKTVALQALAHNVDVSPVADLPNFIRGSSCFQKVFKPPFVVFTQKGQYVWQQILCRILVSQCGIASLVVL